ncbi:MAG: CIA30 family protein [Treponema sp.]|jgi:hypothetical protein|nr:CIA30 family protein [Treponema sp.]
MKHYGGLTMNKMLFVTAPLCAALLAVVTALFTGCGGKGAVEAGRLESADGCFTLYTYDDATDRGNSVITLYRESIMDETGGEEAAWTVRGRVSAKYKDGYAGVVLVPDEKTLERLRGGAEAVKLRISGDGGRYRFSLDTENVKDGNTFGREITAPERAAEIVIPFASLKQDVWGVQAPFDPALIRNLKIQTVGQPVSSFSFTIRRVEVTGGGL